MEGLCNKRRASLSVQKNLYLFKESEKMRLKNMSDIAVIILNYNGWKQSVEEMELCNKFLQIDYGDIIIVDNASTDNSSVMLKNVQKDSEFILLESKENKGYAAGNNLGMRYAYKKGYQYAWILNNDIVIDDKDILNKIKEIFCKDAFVAVVNPDIYAPDGHMFNRDAKKPTFLDYTINILGYKKQGRQVTDLGGYAYVYRPQGCCMMVDLKKMNEVNYMDEKTFLYVEEPILAERLLAKGYKCACCLTASIVHNHSKTVKSTFKKNKIRKMKIRSFKYYLKEYRKFNPVQVWICAAFDYLKWVVLE